MKFIKKSIFALSLVGLLSTNMYSMEKQPPQKKTFFGQVTTYFTNFTNFLNRQKDDAKNNYICCLSPEMLLKILGYLPPKDLASWACTCQLFNAVLKEAELERLNLNASKHKDILFPQPLVSGILKKLKESINDEVYSNPDLEEEIINYFDYKFCQNFTLAKKLIERIAREGEIKNNKELILIGLIFMETAKQGWSDILRYFSDQNSVFFKIASKNGFNYVLQNAIKKEGNVNVIKIILENDAILKLADKDYKLVKQHIDSLIENKKYDVLLTLFQGTRVLDLMASKKVAEIILDEIINSEWKESAEPLVKFLVQNSSLLLGKEEINNVVKMASQRGGSEVLLILLKSEIVQKLITDLTIANAIEWAVFFGHEKVVKIFCENLVIKEDTIGRIIEYLSANASLELKKDSQFRKIVEYLQSF